MTSYTVTDREGCRLVFGNPPLNAMAALTKGLSRAAVMDSHASRLLSANLAMGEPAALTALLAQPDVLPAARARVAATVKGLSANAAEWYAAGEHGLAALAIFWKFTQRGRPHDNAPQDPSDLRRCRLLLEQVPEFRPLLEQMASVSAAWAAIIRHWPSLIATMDRETPDWRQGKGSSPDTYAALNALHAGSL